VYATPEDRKVMNYVRTGGGILQVKNIFNPSTDRLPSQRLETIQQSSKLTGSRPKRHALRRLQRGTKGGDFSAPILPPVIPPICRTKAKCCTTMNRRQIYARQRPCHRERRRVLLRLQGLPSLFVHYLGGKHNQCQCDIKGAELEIHAKPIESLELAFGASRLEGAARNIKLPSGRITDRDMPMTPPFDVKVS